VSYLDAKGAVQAALRHSQSQTRELATWGVIAYGARADRAEAGKVPAAADAARSKAEREKKRDARRRRQGERPHEDGRGDSVDFVA
jgi:hypothetical protein